MAEKNIGKITQVISAVLDIKFPQGGLPEINDAIEITTKDGGVLTVEVAQHLGDDTVRCIPSIRFYVFLKTNPRIIIGTVCLHDILRMPYCCSEIGYKLDAAFQHQGYAREAVTKVLNIAFTDLSLHRVFARVMPENTPSLRLLEAIGFTCEGTEYACTQIQGKWKDHIRYALLNPYSSI